MINIRNMQKTIIISFFAISYYTSFSQVGIGTTTPSGMLHIVPTAANALVIDPYGTNAGETGEIQFKELAANGSNHIGFKAPDDITSDVVFILPSADGTSGQALVTDGSGILSWASSSNGWWEELGRTTLTSTSDAITISSFTAKKYLLFLFYAIPSGAISGGVRFNNDSGTNYSRRRSINGGSDLTDANSTNIGLAMNQESFSTLFVINSATEEKLTIQEKIGNGASGAGTAPGRDEGVGKWGNTSSQITRVDLVNFGAGDFAAGSQVVVLGHD